jgi:hypothetical protein
VAPFTVRLIADGGCLFDGEASGPAAWALAAPTAAAAAAAVSSAEDWPRAAFSCWMWAKI